MSNVREEVLNAAEHLALSGSGTPKLDAELLLCKVMGTDRAGLVMRGDADMSADDRTLYLALLTRRVKHEPVAYILGRQEFRHLTLVVDPRVLIPRPETEFLVESALALPRGIRVLDIGTGSGAVALALKDERPDLHVTGIDISSGALSVARMNRQRLKLDVTLQEGDLLAGAPQADAIVANLPYVRDSDLLPPDVAIYEPSRALLGGPDGLDLVRELVAQAGAIRGVKTVALEIGQGQSDLTAQLLSAAGFDEIERILDLAGIERVIVGRR